MTSQQRVSIRLTPEQRAELQKATGKSGGAIEFAVEELEERIAPSFLSSISTPLAEPRPDPLLGGNWVSLK